MTPQKHRYRHEKIWSITIPRSDTGFGFSICWMHPPVVDTVKQGSHADKEGLLVGDQIVLVNKEEVAMTNKELVIELIKNTGNLLELGVVRRHGGNAVAAAVKSNTSTLNQFSLAPEEGLLHHPDLVLWRRRRSLQRFLACEESFASCIRHGMRHLVPRDHCAESLEEFCMSEAEKEVLFQNIKEICDLADCVILELKRDWSCRSSIGCLGKILLNKLWDIFAVYRLYFRGFPTARTLLAVKFLEDDFANRSGVLKRKASQVDIVMFLERPLKHVFETISLAEKVFECTPVGHSDYRNLEKVTDALKVFRKELRTSPSVSYIASSKPQAGSDAVMKIASPVPLSLPLPAVQPIRKMELLDDHLVFRTPIHNFSCRKRSWVFGGSLYFLNGKKFVENPRTHSTAAIRTTQHIVLRTSCEALKILWRKLLLRQIKMSNTTHMSNSNRAKELETNKKQEKNDRNNRGTAPSLGKTISEFQTDDATFRTAGHYSDKSTADESNANLGKMAKSSRSGADYLHEKNSREHGHKCLQCPPQSASVDSKKVDSDISCNKDIRKTNERNEEMRPCRDGTKNVGEGNEKFSYDTVSKLKKPLTSSSNVEREQMTRAPAIRKKRVHNAAAVGPRGGKAILNQNRKKTKFGKDLQKIVKNRGNSSLRRNRRSSSVPSKRMPRPLCEHCRCKQLEKCCPNKSGIKSCKAGGRFGGSHLVIFPLFWMRHRATRSDKKKKTKDNPRSRRRSSGPDAGSRKLGFFERLFPSFASNWQHAFHHGLAADGRPVDAGSRTEYYLSPEARMCLQGVLVEDTEDSSSKQWNVAAMETYMLERAEEHVALGLLTPEDVVNMRHQQQKKAPDSENGTESGAEEESSPSWASSSAGNTPSYGSSGLAFDFGQKCTISADNLLAETAQNGRSGSAKSTTAASGRPTNGRRSSILRLCGSLSSDQLAGVDDDSGPESPGADWNSFPKNNRKGSADNVPPEVYPPMPTSGQAPGKLSRLLRRTQSAGCSKDVPAHALFLREKRPITKTKSADPAPGCERDDVTERLNKKGRKTLAQDMKLRLSFLRRRHTDTSIQQPPSIRPSPEEAQKWAHSFNELMNNKYGLALFRAFLSREFCEENIEFWLACEAYKKVRTNKLPSKARKIYNDFIAVQAPKEVNLDPNMRAAMQNNLSNPDPHFFDQAQRRIQGLLEQDAYMRFLQSDLYTELLCDNSR